MYELQRFGGNSMRFWLHPEGEMIPVFDQNGYITGMDQSGSLIRELKDMLDNAQKNNILITICLWNGALQRTQRYNYIFFYNILYIKSYDKYLVLSI